MLGNCLVLILNSLRSDNQLKDFQIDMRLELCQVFYSVLFFLPPFFLRWVFVAVCRLSVVAVSGGYSSLRSTGFSLRWLPCCGGRALGVQASVVVACGLSSCGTRAQLLRGMWGLPGPGLEPVSPALAGGFLTTAPPGKPIVFFSCANLYFVVCIGHLLYLSSYLEPQRLIFLDESWCS